MKDAHFTVVVVGAGFAGIGAAITLRKLGIDFAVLEKASDIGGVWRDNSYPDCGCDIPSALYSYSFAPNPFWDRLFAKQKQIKQYTHDTAEKFGVMPHVQLNTELIHAQWIAPEKQWRLKTSQGVFTAQFVIMACGPMHVPITPLVKGLETFKGKQFHSSQWDHTYDFQNKRVAVIGSGASAIQFLPLLQKQVGQLTLFQRTAPWVLPKMDAPISRLWQNRFEKFPFLQSLFRGLLYLQFEMLNGSLKYPFFLNRLQSAGLKNIHRGIQDPQLRAQVTPDYSVGCKRILQSNTWYRALAQPNVQVVSGIAEIQGSTLFASDGSQCEVDALVFATGFEVADPPIAQRIVGVSGQTLASLWGGSASAHYGTMVQDCPNLFLTFGPNLYTFSSAFVIIEAQLQWIASALTTAKKKKLRTIAVNPLRFASYNTQVQSALQKTVWNSGCSSYFIDKNGRNSTNWPWTTFYMRWKLARFQAHEFLVDTGP